MNAIEKFFAGLIAKVQREQQAAQPDLSTLKADLNALGAAVREVRERVSQLEARPQGGLTAEQVTAIMGTATAGFVTGAALDAAVSAMQARVGDASAALVEAVARLDAKDAEMQAKYLTRAEVEAILQQVSDANGFPQIQG